MRENAAPGNAELAAYYAAAAQDCLVVEHEPPGVLSARGATVLDFLQRMSTNDMAGLVPGETRGTVLTNAIGRIVDVIRVIPRTSEVLLVTGPGRAHADREWLSRYIFFQDDVSLSESGTEYRLWGLYGPHATRLLEEVAGRPIEIGGSGVAEVASGLAWRREPDFDGLQLLLSPEETTRADRLWGDRAPGSSAWEAYQALRIERGIPEAGREIDEDAIPLEVGLDSLVNFRKGCYIGQEIIARMESRGQTARRLMGARLDRPADPPQAIEADGQVIGRLTSVGLSPRLGPIGLAVIRTSTPDPEQRQFRLSPSGGTVRLSALPF